MRWWLRLAGAASPGPNFGQSRPVETAHANHCLAIDHGYDSSRLVLGAACLEAPSLELMANSRLLPLPPRLLHIATTVL